MISRDQALTLIRAHVKNENIVKHMLALGAVMTALYDRLQPTDGSTGQEWYMAGLLHDGDYCDEVPANKQGIQITTWAEEAGFRIPEHVAHAMAAHNRTNTGVEPKSLFDWSIFCADSLTGLIVAATLVIPSKKLADVKVSSVLKRFKESGFARGTRREDIVLCQEKLGLSLEEFVSISLTTMQNIADDIGL
jgi:predicted hydrolase (HD superfamily)